MKNLAKIIGAAFTTAVILAAFTVSVFAEGLSVSADKESCEVGEKITVTISADGAGDGVLPPDVQVEFNSNRLNFENCSVDYGGGGGGLVTFKDKGATVEFTTLSGGNADINVTATPDDGEGPLTGSVTVAVNGEDTAAALDDAASTATGISQGTIDAGDGRVIQTVFAEEFKPVYFHKETTDYKGQSVECAKFDMGDIILLYTTDATGEDGKFMVYNPSTGDLSDFRMIQGIENRFIIVLSDCEGPIPTGYTKAVLEWSGQTLTAFMQEDVAEGTSEAIDGIDPADFFLVYAVSSEGNKGWYRYDKNEGTYQRFINTEGYQTDGEGSDEDTQDSDSKGILDDYIPGNIQSIIALVCAPLAFILLIVVIILAVKLRDYADDYYEDDYYEDEEEDEEQGYFDPRKGRSGAVTAASLVGRTMSDDDEEDEEDEEDEDDGEEDEEDVAEEEDEDEEEEEDEDDEEDIYDRPLTRKERKELEREEKWRRKEEKKAAKRRAQGYEEATPMDWSSFEKKNDDSDVKPYTKSKPPKYMTESLSDVAETDINDTPQDEDDEPKKAPLPPRKKVVTVDEEQEQPHVLHEKDQRERQRRLFEQQQRIEEQRRIESEQLAAQQATEQKKFIQSRTEDLDLDEDFQFEFLKLD